MIDFNEILLKINRHGFQYVKPYNTDKAYDLIKKHLSGNIIIRGDWDVDGGLSAKIIHNYFRDNNYDANVFFGTKKTHGVENEDVEYCKNNKVNLYIIVDSSSNSIDALKQIISNGTDVLIIDHHVTEISYDEYEKENILIINSKMKYNEIIQNISAGFLCYLVTSYWRDKKSVGINKEDLILGYITLISDNCKTDDPYIQDIIFNIDDLREKYTPYEVCLFFDKYSRLNRNWLNFKFDNILNNAFRLNKIHYIEGLLFGEDEKTKEISKEGLVLEYKLTKEKRQTLIAEHLQDICKNYYGVIFVDLNKALQYTDLPKDYLLNSTGLFASNVSDVTNKPAIAYISQDTETLKCSGRDTRNNFPFQDILKQYELDGGGHYAAIGFKMPILELNELFNIGKRFADKINQRNTTIKIVNYNDLIQSDFNFNDLIKVIAYNNEIAHSELKPIQIKFNLKEADKIQEYNKMVSYYFGDYQVKDLLKKYSNDDTVLAQPDFSDNNTLIIQAKSVD